jgi:hypothetical protein
MKFTTKIFTLILFLVLNTAFFASAINWSRVVSLEGMWRFSVGDNMEWVNPGFDDSDWDYIKVPSDWDKYYPGYNGFGWYRKNFEINNLPSHDHLAFILGHIDDVDEVYVNGIKIGQTGVFPPDNESAHSTNRIYHVENEVLKHGQNTIAVRVYDEGMYGGMRGSADIGLFYDNDRALLELDLSGVWKFSIYRQSGIYDFNYNDSDWADINVPGNWEDQGFPDFDGFPWYRKKFSVPNNLMNEKLFLVLGRIDDQDKVFLNGKLIARTEYIEEYSGFRRYGLWQLYRVYEIPENAIKRNNILVVEVKDEQRQGGIYEGPIGLMTPLNAEVIKQRNKELFNVNPVERFFREVFGF